MGLYNISMIIGAIVLTPRILLNDPYNTPVYDPLYNRPLWSFDYSSFDICGCTGNAGFLKLSSVFLRPAQNKRTLRRISQAWVEKQHGSFPKTGDSSIDPKIL